MLSSACASSYAAPAQSAELCSAGKAVAVRAQPLGWCFALPSSADRSFRRAVAPLRPSRFLVRNLRLGFPASFEFDRWTSEAVLPALLPAVSAARPPAPCRYITAVCLSGEPRRKSCRVQAQNVAWTLSHKALFVDLAPELAAVRCYRDNRSQAQSAKPQLLMP